MLRQRVPLLAVVLLLACFALYAEAGRGSGGTYSLPTGNPVTSGTTITSSWANNTLTDIATELTYSLDRQGRGGMLASLQLANGTAASPGATFTSEPNSGLYRSAANDLRMSVNSTDVMKWQTGAVTSLQPLTVAGKTTTSTLTVTGSSDTLTVSASAAGTYGLAASGNGTGTGVRAIGGVSGVGLYAQSGLNQPAIQSIGSGTGQGAVISGGSSANTPGATITSNASGGAAVVATASTGDAVGVNATGHGTSAGLYSVGGATAGPGLYVTGGAGGVGANVFGGANGPGANISAGTGNNYGAAIAGAGSGIGLQVTAGTASTTTTRTDAIALPNGDINMDGTATPLNTTALKNRITPVSFAKAYGAFSIGAASAITQTVGMNVSSITAGGASGCGGAPVTITVTFAQPFSSANYVASLTGGINQCRPVIFAQTASTLQIQFRNTTLGTACAQDCTGVADWNGAQAHFLVFGAQ